MRILLSGFPYPNKLSDNLSNYLVDSEKYQFDFIKAQEVELGQFSAGDTAILGVGYLEDSNMKFDISQITTLIAQLQDNHGSVILATPFLPYASQTPDLYRTSYLTKQITDLARNMQLKLIDLSALSIAYYHSFSIEQHVDAVVNTVTGELKPDGYRALAQFITQWLNKNTKKELFDDYYYGAEIYPEVWPRDILREDVQNLAKVGMNFVRVGEFLWERLEPQENEYDMTYLREILQLLQDNHIKALMCIPTPTPPRWFTTKYPESKIKNIDGTVMEHGSRQHVCTNFPEYRVKAYQLTRKIVQTSREFDNVVGFQIDNEFKCHVDMCYCDTCSRLWHEWLEIEYDHNIDKLNEAWGTCVWSERYENFQDVVLPTTTPFLHNSSLQNAFRRFTVSSLDDFAHGISNLICLESDLPITHNSGMGFNLDNVELFSQMDFAGFDTYPRSSNYSAFLLNLNLWRSLFFKKDYMLLETSTSHVGHIENYSAPNALGYVPTQVFTTFASGAKGFNFWLYRGQRFGVEQPHAAVVTQWGTPDFGYQDVVDSGRLIESMKPLLKRTKAVTSRIAMLYMDEAKRFYTIETGGIYNYRGLVTDYFESLQKNGLTVEVIFDNTNFDNFDCVLVPFIRHVSDSLLARMKAFVERGGKLILGPMTGDRTEELTWHSENGLGKLGKWLHLDNVIQFYSKENEVTKLSVQSGTQKTDVVGLVTAFDVPQTARYANLSTPNMLIGQRTVVTHQQLGQGEVIYLGGLPEDLSNSLLWQKFIDSEIRPYDADQELITVKTEVVKYRRENEHEIQLYLVNMAAEELDVCVNRPAIDELSHVDVKPGKLILHHYDKLVLSFSKDTKK